MWNPTPPPPQAPQPPPQPEHPYQPYQPPQQPYQQQTHALPSNAAAKPLAIVGIVLGVLAALLLPPLFGPAGLICGGIAFALGEKRLGVIAMVVAGACTVIGMALGILVFALFSG
jgi:hypothetical protein